MFEVFSRVRPTAGLRAFLLVTAASAALAGSGIAQTVATPDQQGVITAARLSDVFADITKRVEPAVVSIDVKGRTPEIATRGEGAAPAQPDDIMDFFRRQMPRRPLQSVGSGFIIDRSGHIVTNAHVVDDAVRITVRLDTGEEFPAQVLGTDVETDIAVLKIDANRDLPFARLGNSDRVRVGEWVLAIGSPFGLSRTVTAGIVSQVQRETAATTAFQKFIQTDAAINRGNSGGPLVNIDGEVIGVNSQIATQTGDYNGVGFALPSNETKFVVDQLIANGRVKRGYLGVYLETVKPEFAKVYNMGDQRGAIVIDVPLPNVPAARAGMKPGDVILAFDGTPVGSAKELIAKVSSTPPEKPVTVDILREEGSNLVRKSLTMQLGERPTVERESSTSSENLDRRKLPVDGAAEAAKPFGLTLIELTPQLATTYKLTGQKGLVVKEINPDSYIAEVKLATGSDALGEGDVIQRINRVSVSDPTAFAAEAAKLKKGDPVVLHVATFDRQSRSSTLKIVQFTVQ